MKINNELELNIIRVKTIGEDTIYFDDLEEFLKLVVIEAALYIDEEGDLIQVQENIKLCLTDGEKKLEKVSAE